MNICVFGASITWGASDVEKGGWVQRLRTFVESTKEDVDIYNLGVSGDTTDDLLKRFKVECEARKPEKIFKIIFGIGTNDSQYILTKKHPKTTIEKFEENLETLISQAKEFTNDIVFCGLLPVDESKTTSILRRKGKFYDNENILKYNAIIKSVTEKHNLKFIDLNNIINLEDLPDGLHLNSAGHQKIFEVVKDEMIDVWEPVIDFTKIKTGGVDIKEIKKNI